MLAFSFATVTAADIGNNAGDLLGTEAPKPTIYKCNECKGTFRDSSGLKVPAKGTPTKEIDTHF